MRAQASSTQCSWAGSVVRGSSTPDAVTPPRSVRVSMPSAPRGVS
jgi:hypothetical protein